MFRYAIILRSMTSGRGTFTMEYDHYEEVPAAEIAKKVIAAHKREDEEEWLDALEKNRFRSRACRGAPPS